MEECGIEPQECDICLELIVDDFVDGETKSGPWANMCPLCHAKHGRGLGIGKGQRYCRNVRGNPGWTKVVEVVRSETLRNLR
jgi:hypothetical protein